MKSILVAIMALSLGPVCFAKPILFTYESAGAGSINGVAFPTTSFTITARGDTTNRLLSFLGNYFIAHDSAKIELDGIGTYLFTTQTHTFRNNSNFTVGFTRTGNGDLINRIENPQFNQWDMLSSIGPITDTARLLQWSDPPQVFTSGGILFFNTANRLLTFTATVVPEPSSIMLVACSIAALAFRRPR
jgi:hypothetical protein